MEKLRVEIKRTDASALSMAAVQPLHVTMNHEDDDVVDKEKDAPKNTMKKNKTFVKKLGSTAVGDSILSRLFRHFAVQTPMVNRYLPKIKSGRLLLEVGEVPEWKRYEVVLAGASIDDLGLYYYASKADTIPLGCIYLHSAHIDVLEEVLMVVTKEKTWFMCAENEREANDWAEGICAAIEKVSQKLLLHGQEGIAKRRRLSSHVSSFTLREIQSREPKARVDEFLEVFVRSNQEDICIQATKGAFSWSCMRNIAWKLWLNYLPLDAPFRDWVAIARAKREKYESSRKRLLIFQDFMNGIQIDEDFINACESSQDNLLYSIFKDVRRTRGSLRFFRDLSVQCMLIRVLYTYSVAHPEISYNQGMGELLATIVYLLYIEQWTTTTVDDDFTIPSAVMVDKMEGSDSEDASYVYVESFINIQNDSSYLDRDAFLALTPFAGRPAKYTDCCKEAAEEIAEELTSEEFLEHDAYLLLEEIMVRMSGAYCPERKESSSGPSPSCPTTILSLLSDEMASSPLYDQMNSIHHHLLSRCDPPTARHLTRLGVEPQMFLLRWVRVLMSREFEMPQVWQIWDAIFSFTSHDFSFINFLCVAAVREFREEILTLEDATSVLLCLRDISEKVDAERLVDNARELYNAMMIAAAVEATNELS